MSLNQTFDWRDFIRRIAAIAIPVALQNLLTTTGSMVDTMMIGQLGQLNIAAIGLCAQFTSLMFSCYWGFIGGGTLFFTQYFGAKDGKGVSRSYGITLSFMMAVGLIFFSLAVFAPGAVMRLYTDKPDIRSIGVQYLRIVGFAYPLQVYSMCMSTLLRSTERVRIPLYGSICSVVTNVSMNWILINGKLGLPAMGVRGAALATVLSALVNASVVLILAVRSKHSFILDLKNHFRWSKAAVLLYLKKCAPIIANELLIGVGNMVINIVLGRQSENAIAATAVFRTFEGCIIGFFAGFSGAASILVGTEIGAGHLELAYQRAKRIVFLCAGCIFGVGLVVIALHRPLLTLMNLQGETYDICFRMLLIYCGAAIIRMSNWTQNDTYRASGDASYGTILEIVFMYAMLLPGVLLTGFVFKSPFLVVFACCYSDEIIRFILMQKHMYTGRWVKPVTPEGQAALHEFRMNHDRKYRKLHAA